jgi:hypothetical protein
MSTTVKNTVSIGNWGDNEFKDEENTKIEEEVKQPIITDCITELNTDINKLKTISLQNFTILKEDNDILKNQFLELSKLFLTNYDTYFKPNSDKKHNLTEESAPVEVGSAPVEVGSAPVEVGSAPVEVGSAPVEVGSAPVESIFPPVEICSAPVNDSISINSEDKEYSTFSIKAPINASKRVMFQILIKNKIGKIISVDFTSIDGNNEYKNIIIKIDNLVTSNIYFNKLLTGENTFYKIYYYCKKEQKFKYYKLCNY